MNDKKILNLAIESTNLLSETQKIVLKLLCKSDSPMSSIEIEAAMKLTRQAVHLKLKPLLDRGFITRTKAKTEPRAKNAKSMVFLYALNEQKMLELVERFKFYISKQ